MGKFRSILMAALIFSGCSMEVPNAQRVLQIKVQEATQEAPELLFSSLLSPGIASTPSTAADFNCFAVNVTGQGVPFHSQSLANCTTTDNMRGKGFGVLSTAVTRGQTITVDVPAGTQRTIDLYGVYPALASCGGSAGVNVANGYFLGSVVRDLLESASVSFTPTYNGSSSNLTCIPPSGCSVATTWTSLEDNFQHAASEDAIAYNVGQSAGGALIAVGMGTNTALKRWVIRRSTDKGVSWSTVDDFVITTQNAEARDVGRDASGALYAVGYAKDATPDDHWIVRKSTDGGSTWTTVDNYQLATDKPAQAYAVLIHETTIYVVGVGVDAGNVNHWIVRKSADGGSSWTNIDDFMYSGSINAIAIRMARDAAGKLYVVGQGYDGSFWRWVVRRSADGGSSWATVDDYQLASDDAYAKGVLAASDGAIYVIGAAQNSDIDHWIIRKSTTGDSGSWSTIDDYEYASGFLAFGEDLIEDAKGVIYATGGAQDGSNVYHWVVRTSSNGGTSWAVSDDYVKNSGYDSYGGGVFKDAAGSIYVAGYNSDLTAKYWTVRRAICQ